jgi:hypothetical protein
MRFDITFLDLTTEVVVDAHGYAQEGPLTTFFQSEDGRPPRLDAWSTRLLSVRTDRILRIAAATVSETLPITAPKSVVFAGLRSA